MDDTEVAFEGDTVIYGACLREHLGVGYSDVGQMVDYWLTPPGYTDRAHPLRIG